jgi:hypothetical protein
MSVERGTKYRTQNMIKNLYKTENQMIPRKFREPPLFIEYLNILGSDKVGSLQMDFLGQAFVRPPPKLGIRGK